MASKNEQKIQEIVDAMTVPGIIGTGVGNKITGNQIASTIRGIVRRTSLTTTSNSTQINVKAERGYYPSDKSYMIEKYTGNYTVQAGVNNTTIPTYGKYMTNNITIRGDSNLIPANIRNGTTIFGVTGTYTGTQSQIPYASGSLSLAQNTIVYLTELVVATSNINVLTLSGINGSWNIPIHTILTLIWNNTSPPYYNNGLRLLNTSAQLSPRMFTFEVVSNFTLQA